MHEVLHSLENILNYLGQCCPSKHELLPSLASSLDENWVSLFSGGQKCALLETLWNSTVQEEPLPTVQAHRDKLHTGQFGSTSSDNN